MLKSEALAAFPVTMDIDIRWGDMDAFQHVNNTVFFRFFESARIAYFDATNIVGGPGMAQTIGPIVAATSCRFKAPLGFPDTVTVGARIADNREGRLTMTYAIYSAKSGRIAATGDAVVVAYDYVAKKRADIPRRWLDGIEKVES